MTLQFVPYAEIEGLSSVKRIQKLLKIVKHNKIILLEGRLRSHEEAELIRRTMEEIDEKFKGIELSVVNPESVDTDFFRKLRVLFVNMLLGNRSGFTIIGPATIIKEIKQDPGKIQLFMQDLQKKVRSRRKR
ncbi:DUF2073 domain-containing protein [Candidatus Woesearchaeota archaeon]|nr:DUF2073 domain-containing protein [Candidatus Woesearchaeota archaeon]